MTATFQEILNSRLCKFFVGEGVDGKATEFLVHEAAIAQLSQVLGALMKDSLPEGQAGCTIWPNVSKDTFERFVQFAYTGDYTVPKLLLRLDTRGGTQAQKAGTPLKAGVLKLAGKSHIGNLADVTEAESLEIEGQGSFDTTTKRKKKRNSEGLKFADPLEEPEPEPALQSPVLEAPVSEGSESQGSDLEGWLSQRHVYPVVHPAVHAADFASLDFPLLAARDRYEGTCEPILKFNRNQSYSNVFLAHATLYVLAELQFIDSLKALALLKLHQTLCVFRLAAGNISDVVDLARYAYTEEAKGSDEGDSRLRRILCQYLATNSVILCRGEAFMDLLAEGGQIVRDFFRLEVQMVH